MNLELHVGRGWYTAEYGLVRRVNKNDANGYYKALGLSPDATREEIKEAYYRLAKTLHPDRGGDEELFMFLVDIANVLLDGESKTKYDSVGEDSIYLGRMESEELARQGMLELGNRSAKPAESEQHWACITSGFPPNEDSDAWIYFCRQVSPAVGYRGKIRVGVIEGVPRPPWGILSLRQQVFVVFQRGVQPNRLHALCAMIDLQNHLLNQIRYGWTSVQDRERTQWL